MTASVLLLIPLAAGSLPPAAAGRHPDATEVFHCDFGEAFDANYDLWPDGWTRREGPDFPRYLPIEISEESSPSGDRCLRIGLDGGAAAVFSPPIPASSRFSYVLQAWLRTEGLRRNVAFTSLTFYDADQRPLRVFHSPPIRDADAWKKVTVGPAAPDHDDVTHAVIGLHLRPEAMDQADLRGAALFGDVWLGRMPRMTLRTNRQHSVYSEPGDVEITCEVSGILERDPLMTFELIDVGSNLLAEMSGTLDGNVLAAKKSRASELRGKTAGEADAPPEEGYAGVMTWRPPITDYGFYWVRVTMQGKSGMMQQRQLSVAVLAPAPNPVRGEFGWSLPQGDAPLGLRSLAGLLGQVGINWVKFPVWYSDKEPDRADQIAWFAERLGRHNIELVGVLDQPPADVAPLFGDLSQLVAAGIFAEPELWRPVLHPVLTRLSLKVRWWQLGGDRDASFVGLPEINQRIGEVKKQLERFGQEIHIGVAWRWLNAAPASPPWEFLSYFADPPLTPDETQAYLSALPPQGAKRWVLLEPLPRSAYRVDDRARDLVARMLSARRGGADGVFIPDPFDAEHGLMNADGTPGELLLPWRTTALLIGGAQYLGSLTLPGGSPNHVFARGEEVVMIVWNDQPTREVVSLGEHVEQVDLWGRVRQPVLQGDGHVIDVGRLPTFVTGLNLPITRWQMALAFAEPQLASQFGRPQPNSFRFRNFFEQGIGGSATLVTPEVWDVEPRTRHFKLAAGEEAEEAFRVLLRPDASSGPQAVRIDFEVAADRNYRFSVYRTIEVGLGDVVTEAAAWLNEQGELVVEQYLENRTDDFVSFNCMLFAPDRRRLRQQVLHVPRGRHTVTYVLPDGERLLGKTIWLRTEEIGGDRVLNYRFDAER